MLEWGDVQYEGQVVTGVKHGHGTLRWSDKREFVGDFHDGSPAVEQEPWPDLRDKLHSARSTLEVGDVKISTPGSDQGTQ